MSATEIHCLADIPRVHGAEHGDRPAIECGDGSLTYEEFYDGRIDREISGLFGMKRSAAPRRASGRQGPSGSTGFRERIRVSPPQLRSAGPPRIPSSITAQIPLTKIWS